MPASTADVQVAPAFCWVPPHASTAGGEIAGLAEQSGMPVDPEQRLTLDAMGAEHADGSPAAFEFGIIACRQNLKTYCLRAGSLADLFLFRKPVNIWTVHRGFALAEAFREFKATIDSYDHLRRRVRKIVEENGEEAIETTSGARLLFKLRTPGAGRSLAGDTVVLDEGYAVSPEMVGDLYPTMATRPGAQVRIGSSAGHASSSVLRGIRDRGRAGGDPSLGYVEWADIEPPSCASDDCDHAYGTAGCCLDDPARWQRANYTMGRRIPQERIATFRRSMPAAEFAREEMGWWDDPADATVTSDIDLDVWASLVDRAVVTDGLVMGVHVTQFHEHAAILMAGLRSDGMVQVEVVESRPRSTWLAARAVEVYRAHDFTKPVVLDGSSSANIVIAPLAAAGVPVRPVDFKEYAQACGEFDGLVETRRLRHGGQPELDMAVGAAKKRAYGKTWVWDQRNSAVNHAPLIGASLATWLVGNDDEGSSVYEDRGMVFLG